MSAYSHEALSVVRSVLKRSSDAAVARWRRREDEEASPKGKKASVREHAPQLRGVEEGSRGRESRRGVEEGSRGGESRKGVEEGSRGGESRMGVEDGSRGWESRWESRMESRIGVEDGSRGWESRMGVEDGSRGWESRMGMMEQRVRVELFLLLLLLLGGGVGWVRLRCVTPSRCYG
ncbi:hypothetical protein F7725_017719 [Dissostichus mawsoni]|uniref:Uncharacterized protein n=1 Tax=Dissostichus mawsoni TaxID=36200 RepID=A0A7J5XPJ8_DISMA|nr:hypothetical protein F7725_017719 [Dissostichus mawsoni]